MKWSELRPILDRRLADTRIASPAGNVFAGESPTKLYDVVEALVESEGDVDELEGRGLWSILEEAGLLEPLLEFEWDSLGPTSSWARIQLLHPGGSRSFACWLPEDDEATAIAALEPLSPATASAFFRDLLADNGESYGVWLFGGLHHRPDLISAMAVKECYREWMERASERDPSLWAELRDRVIGESEESDHLRRSRRALEQLKRLGTPVTPEAIRQYRDDKARAGREISDSERRLVLDNYFPVTYREQFAVNAAR